MSDPHEAEGPRLGGLRPHPLGPAARRRPSPQRAYLFDRGDQESWLDRLRKASRRVRARVEDLEPLFSADDGTHSRARDAAVRAAFSELNPRWQYVLWLADVEGLPFGEIGDLLGMNANSVGALVFRARRGLQHSYLSQFVAASTDPACTATLALLVGYVSDRSAGPADPESLPVRRCRGAESAHRCRDGRQLATGRELATRRGSRRRRDRWGEAQRIGNGSDLVLHQHVCRNQPGEHLDRVVEHPCRIVGRGDRRLGVRHRATQVPAE